MEFEIKITGSGSQASLVTALERLSDQISRMNPTEMADGIELEDATLMTEIKEVED